MNIILKAIRVYFSVALVGATVEGQYGVDCSFPVHSKDLSCGDILGDRETLYYKFMDGCRRHGRLGRKCDSNERQRLEMNVRQPQSMVNYTSNGYKIVRAPEKVIFLLNNHWNGKKDSKQKLMWPKGNIYVNYWQSPQYVVNVDDPTDDGYKLKNMLWDATQETMEEWTGMELRPASMYGIRVYTEGTIISPHLDRLPLVISCMVNVAQDLHEAWPLEVYGRDGRAVNITLNPGEMLLYEGASLIRGRPFPLKGRYYADFLIHFEITGRVLSEGDGFADPFLDDFLPPYILPDSPEVEHWVGRNPYGWKSYTSPTPAQVSVPSGHLAAKKNDVEKLAELFVENKRALTYKDDNGWQPIHEAARSGHKDAIEALVHFGADFNARTHGGRGSTPLHLAIGYLEDGEDHPVSRYLINIGGLNLGPEL